MSSSSKLQYTRENRSIDLFLDTISDKRARKISRLYPNFIYPSTIEIWRYLISHYEWDAILDIGANYGEMAIQAYLHRRNESTPILLFEPNLKLKRFLSQTFKNKLNIELNFFALGETNSQAWLKIQEKNSGTSKYVYDKYYSKNSRSSFKKIDIKTLDSLKLQFRNLLVKVDIEGGELAFLKGATETFNQGNEIVILTEFHSFNQEGLNFIEKNFRVLIYSRLRGRLIEIPSNRLKTLQNRFHWDLYLFDIVLINIDSDINFTEVFVSFKERFIKVFRKYFY